LDEIAPRQRAAEERRGEEEARLGATDAAVSEATVQ
jgi:hypothetical protein